MNAFLKIDLSRKKHIFILCFIIGLIFIFSGYFYYRYEENHINNEIYLRLKAIADLKTNQIFQWRKERIEDASVFTKSPLTIKAIQECINEPENISIRKDILRRLKLFIENYSYENIFITNPDGKLFIQTSKDFKIDKITTDNILKSVKKKQILFSDFYYCNTHNQIHLDLSAPIINSQNVIIAVILLRVNPNNYLYPLIQSWPIPSKSSETLIIRKEGNYALFLNELRHKKNTAMKFMIPLSDTEITAVKALLGHNGILEGTDYRGVKVLSYVDSIPGSNWFIISKEDKSEIFEDLYYTQASIIGFTLFLILFTGIGFSFIYKSRQKNLYKNLYNKEKELWESQEEFKTTLYSIGDAVITTDIKGIVKRINPVAEKLTGWTEAEAAGRKLEEVFKIINEDTKSKVENPVEQILRDGLIVGLANHTILVSRDGMEFPIADSGAPIINENGIIVGVVLVFRDQTEERIAQYSLIESMERYYNTLESMLEGCQIINRDWRYTYVNNAALRQGRKTKKELLGKTMMESYPGIDNTELFSVLKRCMNERISATIENEFTFQDGSTGWFDLSIQPIPEGIFILSGDITERKRFEEALRQSQVTYSSLFENSYDAILLTIPDGKILSANKAACEMFKRTEKEICEIGRTGLIDISDTRIHALLEERRRKRLASGEITFVRADGSKFEGEVTSKVFSDSDGNDRTCMIIRDITERKKTEFALLNKEKILRSNLAYQESLLASLSSISFITTDFGTLVTSFSVGAEKIFGYTAEEMIGQPVAKLHIPEDVAKFPEIIQSQLESKIGYEGEMTLVRKDGTRFPAQFITSPIKNESGEVIAFLGVSQDITERKKSEEALRESEKRFRLYYEQSPIGYQSLDIDGRINVVNQKWIEILGYSLDEVIGKWFGDFLVEEQKSLFRERFPKFKQAGSTSGVEFNMVCKNGQIKSVSFEGRIGTNPDGSFKQTHCVMTDITERKRAEDALIYSEKKYREVVESANEIIYKTDLKGNFTYVNPSGLKLVGYEHEELMNLNYLDLITPEYRNLVERFYFKQYIDKTPNSYIEFPFQTKDGNVKWFGQNSTLLFEDNEAVGFQLIARDITDRKHAE
ncbi:MAG: PAS domain S-box protein, partial [Ignavibacteriae bacterium]|nr:PAS domain S-box protein [Ignavibacteriota bacterium]